jgi:hypothetical protein
MQPGAIPFESTPRSFAVSTFILITMVYAIRFIGSHVQLCWPLLQNSFALRLKRKKVGENIDEFTELPLPTGIELARTNDVERHAPRACETRAVLGRPVTGPQINPVWRCGDSNGQPHLTVRQLSGSMVLLLKTSNERHTIQGFRWARHNLRGFSSATGNLTYENRQGRTLSTDYAPLQSISW